MLRVIGVSKKHNSVWRVYYHDYNDDDKLCLFTEKINPLLVWYYKLKKQKLYNNICDICGNEFKFYKKRFKKCLTNVLNVILISLNTKNTNYMQHKYKNPLDFSSE